jgi:ribosomal protein S9
MSSTQQRVQCFGKKKTATAVAQCKVRPSVRPSVHTTLSIP